MVVIAEPTGPQPAHAAPGIDLVPQSDHDGMAAPEIFEVRLRAHRRTVLIELFGELDIATVSQVADAFDGLAVDPNSPKHIVLDLRGLTFMDATGIHELARRSNEAHQNQHSLTVIRGGASISRLMAIAAVDALLVLVESPEDLSPPIATASRRPNERRSPTPEATPRTRAAGVTPPKSAGSRAAAVLCNANGSSLDLL